MLVMMITNDIVAPEPGSWKMSMYWMAMGMVHMMWTVSETILHASAAMSVDVRAH